MALISQSDLEAKMGRSLTAEEASAFVNVNLALQSWVENYIGSSVEAVDASTRYYDGGIQHLKIDPCTNVSALKLYDDDQVATFTYDSTDYTVEPINNGSDSVKTMIRYRNGKFATGIRNIGVTAKFSIYADTKVRSMVKDAMLNALVSEMTASDNVKRESIEGYSIEYISERSKDALAPIKYLFPEII